MSRRNNRIRQEVAAEAARIMATEGQRSYLGAKQKAARRLGLSTSSSLPSNTEVEQALREWHELYGGEEHATVLQDLRQAALSAMQFFAPFRPRLVGPVLEGTADAFSRISLHVFLDDPDAIIHFLLERKIPFEQESRRIRWHDGHFRQLEIVVIDAGGQTIELILMIGRNGLQAPPSPVDGRAQKRMGASELEKLLDTSA